MLDSTASLRGSVPMEFIQATLTRLVAADLVGEVDGQAYTQSASPTYGASGLAGVWAEQSLAAAMKQANAERRRPAAACATRRAPRWASRAVSGRRPA